LAFFSSFKRRLAYCKAHAGVHLTQGEFILKDFVNFQLKEVLEIFRHYASNTARQPCHPPLSSEQNKGLLQQYVVANRCNMKII